MVRITADHIATPLGLNTASNMAAIRRGDTAIRLLSDISWCQDVYGSAFSEHQWKEMEAATKGFDQNTRLERAMIFSITKVMRASGADLQSSDTRLLIATTKGNIDILEGEYKNPGRSLLYQLGTNIERALNTAQPVQIVSNACISGLLAIIVGARMIEAGHCNKVVVCGADLFSRFTLSGFQGFHAVSPEPCRPYDAARQGISLGEAVATCVLEKSDNTDFPRFIAGASANDANHISGPSRTGEGLYQAMKRVQEDSSTEYPGFISAHGTATSFNDEMECQAMNRMGLQEIPLHSMKGVFGHTLGAAGVLETVVGLHALREQWVPASLGFRKHGVTQPLNVVDKAFNAPVTTFLKTSSGFGGCNAAALFAL
ncbi:MAG: beta-ketoacyl synthase [Cryomorphaceae bacterium]|nr:MAG: beta-ketoacyl synthase [Cryomorphaceae bacterium]